MSEYHVSGFWLQAKGYVKQKWYTLIDNRSGQQISCREVVVGKVQSNYQVDKTTAEHCVSIWEKRLSSFG